MKNKIKSFTESLENNESLESSYTVGDLKNFIKDLPNDMPVKVMHEEHEFYQNVYVVNSSKLDLTHPTTGDYFDMLLIDIDQ